MINVIIKVNGFNYIGRSDNDELPNSSLLGWGWGSSTISAPVFNNEQDPKVFDCMTNIKSHLQNILIFVGENRETFKSIEIINNYNKEQL
jgi:hypothetical protein